MSHASTTLGHAVAGTPTPVISLSPVTLPAPGRAVELQVRVTAPVTGDELPVVLLSHGQGRSHHLSSLDGYAPLASFWAAQGFVVVQPTHLSSTTLRLDPDDADGPLRWRSRAQDMTRILDHPEAIEAAVPGLTGRLDWSRVAVAGHSMGGHTASLLLGARLTDPQSGTDVTLADPRIIAGVLLAAPGRGDALVASVADAFPVLAATDFSTMTTPTLIVAGDADTSAHMTVGGPEWHADPYHLSPGSKSLLTLFGAEHSLGGVSGYDVAETTDDDPERLAAVQQLTGAYLRTALDPHDPAWEAALDALAAEPNPQGRLDSK